MQAKLILETRKKAKAEMVRQTRLKITPRSLRLDKVLVLLAVSAMLLSVLQLEVPFSQTAWLVLACCSSTLSLLTVLTLYQQQLFYFDFANCGNIYHKTGFHRHLCVIKSPSFLVQAAVCCMHSPPGVLSPHLHGHPMHGNYWLVASQWLRAYLLLRLVQFHPRLSFNSFECFNS